MTVLRRLVRRPAAAVGLVVVVGFVDRKSVV